MATEMTPEAIETQDGLPRRRAIQGLAGSLAGIAALGAVGASAKKKKKKKKNTKGKLVKFEIVEASASTEPLVGSLATATASCPAAGTNESVNVVGGGYSVTGSIGPTDFTNLASEPTNNGQGWTTQIRSETITAKTVTTTAVCAYFKTK